MTEDILVTEGLTKDFIGLRALNKLDIAVEKGQIHGLIGPNGSGKTTFFNVVTGLLPATEGKVYFDSTDITTLKPHVIASMGISRTFQAGKLAPGMTVLENVMSGAYLKDMLVGKPFNVKAAHAKLGEVQLELLQPLEEDSFLGQFLKTNGEGLNHIAFHISNWDEIVPKLEERGCKTVLFGISPHADINRWGYFETKPGGILLELDEKV